MEPLELTIDLNTSPGILLISLKKASTALPGAPDLIQVARTLNNHPGHLVIHSEASTELDDQWSYYVLLLSELATHFHRQIRFIGPGSNELSQWIESKGGSYEFKTCDSVELAIDELEVQFAA